MKTFFESLAKSCRDVPENTRKSQFNEIALGQLDALFGYAMALTRNNSDAEDLVQETYLRAAQASGRLDPDSHIRAWLHTILRNTFFNQIRRYRSGPAIVDLDGDSGLCSNSALADERAVDPLASFLSGETKRDVQQAVDSLPDAFREVIVLREYQELTYQEIAEIVQVPVGTVMSRLGRARDRLRHALQHLNQEATL